MNRNDDANTTACTDSPDSPGSPDSRSFTTAGHAIAKCRHCKHVRRVAFTVTTTQGSHLGRMTERQSVSVNGGPQTAIRDKYAFDMALYRQAGTCDSCGERDGTVRAVRGVLVADKNCNSRCMGSTGPSCECSCAGQNHGANYD